VESIRPPSHRLAVLRLILPPLLAVVLFAAAVSWLIIPATTEALTEGKRETLRAIVASALSLCERHHAEEVAGRIDHLQAQRLAAADLRALRYGESNKDYLWVIDDHAHMIAHPYRPDLEGLDLTGYADPDGVRLFAASADLVRHANEGFISYRWQWQDDHDRIEPKLSYVRGFAPWGWVVGSGLYLHDVAAETARTTRFLAWIAVGVGVVVTVLVGLGLRQGWASERARRAAEAELVGSHARFEALAHASSEAVWLVVNGHITVANRRANELLGHVPDMADELFADHADRMLAAGGAAGPRQVLLASAQGPVPSLIQVEPVMVQGQAALVLTARVLADGSRLPDESDRRIAAEALNDATAIAQAGLLAPAAALARFAAQLPLTATPGEINAKLAVDGGSAVLLTAPDGGVAGLVTAGDLARRGGATAYAAMSAPLKRLTAEASLAEAADAMAEAQIGRLAIPGPDGHPRLLHAAQLLAPLRQGPGQLMVAAAAAADQAALSNVHRNLDAWMASLARIHIDPELAAHEGTRIADAILQRCIILALAERGAPPSACAFLSVGSQARHDLLPGSDQDNMLVFADGADPRWFQGFASDVVARFHAAGWPRCHGGCHAGNIRWCLPLSGWRDCYANWINHAEPQALLETAVFFDARHVWGEATLAGELAASIRHGVASRPVFLVQLAQEILHARSPLGLFGVIRPDDQRLGTINLKLAMLHITGFARVQALAHAVPETGTGARLRSLAASGYLPADSAAEALDTWRFLLGLRLRSRTRPGGGDHLDPASLSAWDHAQLKRALATVDSLRERLRLDLNRFGA
jgi:signal-transduction protein with cAMP-binding, CBS, and nucleotidyltransferase domain/PAS domain-containing protein